MVLTPLAQDLAQPVRELLLQVQSTLESTPRFNPATSTRHFSLAVSDYVTRVVIVDLLRHVKAVAPGITFGLRAPGTRAAADLERNQLDFLVAPEEFLAAAQPKEVLFEDTHTCIVWTGNTQVGSVMSVEQYLSSGHVAVRVAEDGANYDERVLQGMNYQRRVEVITPSFDLAPQLVIGTHRIATVATRLAIKHASLLPIRLVPLPIEIPPMVEMLQWHRVHERDPAHVWLRTQLREVLATMEKATA
jgi:DNA-binding transcriptional LysR family regulator